MHLSHTSSIHRTTVTYVTSHTDVTDWAVCSAFTNSSSCPSFRCAALVDYNAMIDQSIDRCRLLSLIRKNVAHLLDDSIHSSFTRQCVWVQFSLSPSSKLVNAVFIWFQGLRYEAGSHRGCKLKHSADHSWSDSLSRRRASVQLYRNSKLTSASKSRRWNMDPDCSLLLETALYRAL